MLALFFFGGHAIHSFTATMLFGVVLVGTYTSIFIAAPILIYLGVGLGRQEADEPAPAKFEAEGSGQGRCCGTACSAEACQEFQQGFRQAGNRQALSGGRLFQNAAFSRTGAIDSYGRGGFRFAGMSHRGSLLCLPSGIYAWPVTEPDGDYARDTGAGHSPKPTESGCS